jgi:hypothetical protein
MQGTRELIERVIGSADIVNGGCHGGNYQR